MVRDSRPQASSSRQAQQPEEDFEDFGGSENDEELGLESDDDGDADAPRVAMWNDEDEDDEDSDGPEEEEEDQEEGQPRDLSSLQSDLSSLPLGALRKAQQALSMAKADSDSEEDPENDGSDDGPPEEVAPASSKGKEKEKQEWSIRPRPDIAKRSNKHAPIEVTSKRPVTRRRTVVEVKAIVPRDPRFLAVAGEFSQEKFKEQYKFLADAHTTELRALRENLKAARKQLTSSPRHLREEREQEVQRIEFALKRAESLVNRDRREKVDSEALGKISQDEKEKRKAGKGGWWMKEADKKELLVRARYDALANSGGKGAVKKAIEKKQKKISQKEKKSRPFAKGSGGGGASAYPAKRPMRTQTRDDGGGGKRQRTE